MKKRFRMWLGLLWNSVYETRYLTIPLSVIALICLYLWKYSTSSVDFGLNAFTETLGIIVTVLIVDQLIKNQEFRKSLPLRAAAYEDVRLLISRIVSFWDGAYKQAVPLPTPATVEELFTEARFNEIAQFLDLDSKPNVIPARTWWQHLPEQQKDFIERGERILERHAGNLEPQTYSYVHTFTTGWTSPDMLNGLRQADKQLNFPRPHNLGSYYYINEEVLNTILQTYKWCKDEKQLLERYGLSIKLSVPERLNPRNGITSPPCMISPEKLQEQLRAVEEFRKQSANKKTNEK